MDLEWHEKHVDKLEAENKSLIIDIGTYVELTSNLATENKRLREALVEMRPFVATLSTWGSTGNEVLKIVDKALLDVNKEKS